MTARVRRRVLYPTNIGESVQAHDDFLDDIAALTDPGADRLLFWDDSAGAVGWLTVGDGLTITGTTIALTNSRTGEFFWFTGDSPPSYALECDGSAISRTTYADLWTHAQASGILAASEGAKEDGEFGPGDGSTTFTLPDLVTSGRFIRSHTGSNAGEEQAQSTQEHKHKIPWGFTVSNIYGERNASNNPVYGSDAYSTGRLYVSSAGWTYNTGSARLAYSDDTLLETSGNTHPPNVSLLPCVVF